MVVGGEKVGMVVVVVRGKGWQVAVGQRVGGQKLDVGWEGPTL